MAAEEKSSSQRKNSGFERFWVFLQTLRRNSPKTAYFFFFVIFPASLWWWYFLGICKSPTAPCPGRRIMLIALSIGSFMVGCIVGFLFSSYGEESGTIGKVRDWLLGGVTGIAFADLSRGNGGALARLLHRFTIPPATDNDFALTVSITVTYLSLGFLFMFFQRELILNVVLAKSRAERGDLDGTRQAGLAIQKLLANLPPSVLAGVTDIGETDVTEAEKQDLRNALDSDDVSNFLKQAESAAKNGIPLDWDTVSKVAHVYYYKSYFAEEKQKPVQVRKALDWIRRALAMNPLHADLTMKYADMLGADHQTDAAIAVLEALRVRPEAPAVVEQWLGYYLRSIPERVDDAIEHSNRFLSFFSDDPDTAINLAYAYGIKYCERLRSVTQPDQIASDLKAKILVYLEKGLRKYPSFCSDVQDWTKDPSLACLSTDQEFKKLLEEASKQSTASKSS
jgi:tetratricopeptide (TPR) repeat protein